MVDDIEKAKEEQEEKHLDELASHIMACFDRAKRHRDSIGVSESITDCLRRYRGKYDDEDKCKFDGIMLYRGLTGMLVRSTYSWLQDAYFNAQDRPWTLEPTPEPELPETIQEELAEALSLAFQQSESFGSIQSADAKTQREFAQQLKNTASEMAMEYAMESAEGMSRTIEDQLLESDWRNVLHDHLLDVAVYPSAILKGPIVRKKEVPVWNKNKYDFKSVPRYYVERIDPKNIYPSPDSTNPQDGEFIIDMMEMTRSRLIESMGLKDFMEEAVKLVISESDHSNERPSETMPLDSDQTELDGVGRRAHQTDGNVFTVYDYHGRISGDYLLEFLDLHEELDEAMENFDKVIDTKWGRIDPYEDYEVNAWVCNGVTMMVRMNPAKPIPYRPFYVTSAFKVPNSFWGESIPMVIADLQDELNMAARSRAYNMGMSSGPIVEADISRFPDNEVPESIQPWDVYPVHTNSAQNNNSNPALRFTNVPNASAALTAVMEETWDKAHKIAGIPPYMYGDNRGSAQTLGAFSLQYAGATKGIKTIISNVDIDVIEKLVQQFYFWNMEYHEDDSIKADARVNVRGAAGLIAQEQRQARPLELLNALGPVLAQMQPETALALVNETLKESGYDPKDLGAATGNLDQEAANRQVGVGGIPVDGRSGSVAQGANTPLIPAPVQGR